MNRKFIGFLMSLMIVVLVLAILEYVGVFEMWRAMGEVW